MKDVFVQIEGLNKGKEVELIKELNKNVVVRGIDTDFVFYVPLSDFRRCYKRKENVKNPS